MIKMVRSHPSLLFWCGGNELYPEVQFPANATHSDPGQPSTQLHLLGQLGDLVKTLDAGRLFVPSSMSNYSEYDPHFALAPTDGNYGINPPEAYFERNPTLRFRGNNSRMLSVKIAFQPEIGSVSSPVVESLRRFLSPEALAAFPRNASGPVHPSWAYHNYEDFTAGANGVDYLGRYGEPKTLELCVDSFLDCSLKRTSVPVSKKKLFLYPCAGSFCTLHGLCAVYLSSIDPVNFSTDVC